MAETALLGGQAERPGKTPPEDGAERPGGNRLDDREVTERLQALEEILAHLERLPGPTAETALDAVALLTQVYGEALARVMDRLAAHPDLAGALAADDLVGHLLGLHGVHPVPVAERITRALADIRPHLRARGGDAELIAVSDGVARIRLSARGCGSSAAQLRQAVEAAIGAAAPELSGIEQVTDPPARPAAFVPAEALLRKPEGAR